jgi:hypothetical protein
MYASASAAGAVRKGGIRLKRERKNIQIQNSKTETKRKS